MREFQQNRSVVKLDNVKQNNIVIADLSQRLSETVFAQQYKKAAEIVQKIIAEAKDWVTLTGSNCRFCKSRNCSSCRYRDYSDCKSENQHKYNRTQFQTAVPFIGERGSGKTSVLCSVLDYLSNFRGNGNENSAFYIGSENNDVRFITFDMIDANTLKCTEDVMEIILSRMLSYLEEIQSDADFRELYRMIDELHRDLGLIYWKKPEARDGYGLTSLQRVADSQKVIDKFSELVDRFTKDVSRYKFDNRQCFLVIALDDIDMYMGSHSGMRDGQFVLLEQIYNHMRTPGLIVLMTFNEHILRRKCNEHFSDIYFGSAKPKDWECRQSAQNDVEILTAQFMSKIFPQERRVYLPNYSVVDLGNRSNLYIHPTLTKNGEEKPIWPFKSAEDVPVKEFMLRLIAHRTGVYFDSAGSKQHFFEPRNLRELGEMFQVLNCMESADSAELPEEVKRRNRQELMDYLYNQYALGHLKTEEYRNFQKLSMLPLERQNKTIVDQIRQQREKVVTSKESTGYLDKTKRDRWKYSYGELIHNLYFSTRIVERGADKTFYSKEFMHCILGTRSVLLNQLVQGPDARENLRGIIGSSIAGRWANEMLPKFSDNGKDPTAAGSLSLPVRFFINWKIPEVALNTILNLHKDDSPESQKVLYQYIEAMTVVGMFFTGFPHNGLKIVPVMDRDEDKSCVIYLRSTSEDHICFNVLNFVINLYGALPKGTPHSYLDYMEEKIKKLGTDLAEQFTSKVEDDVSELVVEEKTGRVVPTWSELLRAYQIDSKVFAEKWHAFVGKVFETIRNKITAWEEKYTEFPFVLPVQHFDMMYNIVKRLASGSYYDIPEEAALEEIHGYYVRFYERVAAELAKQDSFYFVKCKQSFSEAFKESYFYMAFTGEGPTHNPYVAQILVEMMRCAFPAQHARENQQFSEMRVKSLWPTEER